MLLSDSTLTKILESKKLIVEPILDNAIQPSSIDLRLGHSFRVFNTNTFRVIDPSEKHPELTKEYICSDDEEFILQPNEFVLATTLEKVTFGPSISGRLEGKSSLGRLGLLVHATAGFIDAGFSGTITLELKNLSPLPIVLRPHMKIGQLAVFQLDMPAAKPYGHKDLGSKYQNQVGATASEYYKNVTH